MSIAQQGTNLRLNVNQRLKVVGYARGYERMRGSSGADCLMVGAAVCSGAAASRLAGGAITQGWLLRQLGCRDSATLCLGLSRSHQALDCYVERVIIEKPLFALGSLVARGPPSESAANGGDRRFAVALVQEPVYG